MAVLPLAMFYKDYEIRFGRSILKDYEASFGRW